MSEEKPGFYVHRNVLIGNTVTIVYVEDSPNGRKYAGFYVREGNNFGWSKRDGGIIGSDWTYYAKLPVIPPLSWDELECPTTFSFKVTKAGPVGLWLWGSSKRSMTLKQLTRHMEKVTDECLLQGQAVEFRFLSPEENSVPV